jgi:hypothetical protein
LQRSQAWPVRADCFNFLLIDNEKSESDSRRVEAAGRAVGSIVCASSAKSTRVWNDVGETGKDQTVGLFREMRLLALFRCGETKAARE